MDRRLSTLLPLRVVSSGLLRPAMALCGTTNGGTAASSASDPASVSTVHEFNGTDGSVPIGELIQASDGRLYGVTQLGGLSGATGTVFRIESDGSFTSLHSFQSSQSDGTQPLGRIVQSPTSVFYGTTSAGGSSSAGVVYSVTPLNNTLLTMPRSPRHWRHGERVCHADGGIRATGRLSVAFVLNSIAGFRGDQRQASRR